MKELKWSQRIRKIFTECISDILLDNWWCPCCLSDNVRKIFEMEMDKHGNTEQRDDAVWYCRCCGMDWSAYCFVDLDFKELYTKHRKLNRRV